MESTTYGISFKINNFRRVAKGIPSDDEALTTDVLVDAVATFATDEDVATIGGDESRALGDSLDDTTDGTDCSTVYLKERLGSVEGGFDHSGRRALEGTVCTRRWTIMVVTIIHFGYTLSHVAITIGNGRVGAFTWSRCYPPLWW